MRRVSISECHAPFLKKWIHQADANFKSMEGAFAGNDLIMRCPEATEDVLSKFRKFSYRKCGTLRGYMCFPLLYPTHLGELNRPLSTDCCCCMPTIQRVTELDLWLTGYFIGTEVKENSWGHLPWVRQVQWGNLGQSECVSSFFGSRSFAKILAV